MPAGPRPRMPPKARDTVGDALKTKEVNTPEVNAALATLTGDIARQVQATTAR